MRALSIVHQRDAGPGVFDDSIRSRDTTLETWIPPEVETPPDPRDFDAVLTFGGAMNAADEEAWLDRERDVLRAAIGAGTPLLGVCLGAELVAQAAGAEVRRAGAPEIGWLEVETTDAGAEDPVLSCAPRTFEAFQWHSFEFALPEGATELARSAVCSQAFRLGSTWAVQFHPEVTLADAELWIGDYRGDPDAVAMGLDPERLRVETRKRIDGWNELGRRICAGFLEVASRRAR